MSPALVMFELLTSGTTFVIDALPSSASLLVQLGPPTAFRWPSPPVVPSPIFSVQLELVSTAVNVPPVDVRPLAPGTKAPTANVAGVSADSASVLPAV